MNEGILKRLHHIEEESINAKVISFELSCDDEGFKLWRWDWTTWGGMPQYDLIAKFYFIMPDAEIIQAIRHFTHFKENENG